MQQEAIDIVMKVVGSRSPASILELAGVKTESRILTVKDVTVSLPEFRADQVIFSGDKRRPGRVGYHLEFELSRDIRKLIAWFLKNAALTAQYNIPIALIVIYLRRGRYRKFPDRYIANADGIKNEFVFQTIHLWEHLSRIRSGELASLAPLLCLCEDHPTIETLEEERDLIQRYSKTPAELDLQLTLAKMVAGKQFSLDILKAVFPGGPLMSIKEIPFLEEWTQQLLTEGIRQGEEAGEAAAARKFLSLSLRSRFGEVPPALAAQIQEWDLTRCEQMFERSITAGSLEDFDPD